MLPSGAKAPPFSLPFNAALKRCSTLDQNQTLFHPGSKPKRCFSLNQNQNSSTLDQPKRCSTLDENQCAAKPQTTIQLLHRVNSPHLNG
jgi:hypothetical protein